MSLLLLPPSVYRYKELKFSPVSVESETFLIPPASIIDWARLMELLMLCLGSFRDENVSAINTRILQRNSR